MEKQLIITIFLSIAINNVLSDIETKNNAFLTTPSLICRYGYPSETHTVQTKDGYLLSIHRIPHEKFGDYSQQNSRPVVFLQHGLLGSSADWVILGPEYSLAFILAEAGYDVWMGNFRGNTYSMESSLIPAAKEKFWDFSWDDYALFDLPAMLNYVLQTTEQTKLDFIGFSQGSATALALLSERPAFNKKINILVALAPIVYLSNTKIPEKVFAPWSKEVTYLDKTLLKGQVFPQNIFTRTDVALCKRKEMDKFCDTILEWIDGNQTLNKTIISIVLNNFPAGSSVKVLDQVTQQVKTGSFSHFDYGEERNHQVYKSKKPPPYVLHKVKLPVAVFYTDADFLATPRDVQQVLNELPNVVKRTYIVEKNFSHFDFIYSTKAKPEVYESILGLLDRRKLEVQTSKENTETSLRELSHMLYIYFNI